MCGLRDDLISRRSQMVGQLTLLKGMTKLTAKLTVSSLDRRQPRHLRTAATAASEKGVRSQQGSSNAAPRRPPPPKLQSRNIAGGPFHRAAATAGCRLAHGLMACPAGQGEPLREERVLRPHEYGRQRRESMRSGAAIQMHLVNCQIKETSQALNMEQLVSYLETHFPPGHPLSFCGPPGKMATNMMAFTSQALVLWASVATFLSGKKSFHCKRGPGKSPSLLQDGDMQVCQIHPTQRARRNEDGEVQPNQLQFSHNLLLRWPPQDNPKWIL